jgi:hypothetical protein
VLKKIMSAVKRVEFVSDRMWYIILRVRWCHIIVLKALAPTEDKIYDVRNSFYEELEHVFDKVPKFHMKILLDFNAKVSKEDMFKPTIWNESLHEMKNNNGVRVVNLTISKNRTVKSMMFLYCNIHKYIWCPIIQGSRLWYWPLSGGG